VKKFVALASKTCGHGLATPTVSLSTSLNSSQWPTRDLSTMW